MDVPLVRAFDKPPRTALSGELPEELLVNDPTVPTLCTLRGDGVKKESPVPCGVKEVHVVPTRAPRVSPGVRRSFLSEDASASRFNVDGSALTCRTVRPSSCGRPPSKVYRLVRRPSPIPLRPATSSFFALFSTASSECMSLAPSPFGGTLKTMSKAVVLRSSHNSSKGFAGAGESWSPSSSPSSSITALIAPMKDTLATSVLGVHSAGSKGTSSIGVPSDSGSEGNDVPTTVVCRPTEETGLEVSSLCRDPKRR
mmetsp:Transcript_30081/g.80274  ORF Transcript_30081/g.80274 Transcript_30081/m.80274 type:complete len:255 (+) Transcript_30081:888-1652(+)